MNFASPAYSSDVLRQKARQPPDSDDASRDLIQTEGLRRARSVDRHVLAITKSICLAAIAHLPAGVG